MTNEFYKFLETEGIKNAEEITKASKNGEPFVVSFDLNIIDASKRIVGGVVSVEDVDRENEIITKSALKNALDGFKHLPILHLQHTERPVGLITKSQTTDKGLEIESKIPTHEQWDDVWDRIEKGDLSKYSIFGRRRSFTPECRLAVRDRGSPCITKGLYLDSISIVTGSSAVNQKSFVQIIKSMQDELISTENIISSETDGNKMTEEADIIKAEDVTQIVDTQISEVTKAFDTKLEELVEKSTAFENDLLEIKKGFEGLQNITEVIEKATTTIEDLKKQNDEIKKANADLAEKVEKMGDEVIKKGQNPVVIADQLKPNSLFRMTNKGV